jgi:hypothetical protein
VRVAAVGYAARLANACEGLADHLAARATGEPNAAAATLAITHPNQTTCATVRRGRDPPRMRLTTATAR